MLESVSRFVLEIIFEFITSLILHPIGAGVIYLCSGGKAYADKLFAKGPSIDKYNWFGMRTDEHGRKAFSMTITEFIGFVTFVVIVALLLWILI
jgi:hypothetical protein